MAELVFWRMFDYLKGLCPEFASCKYRGFLSRFKERAIHALDSSSIQLTLNCFDWARHRRQKAAAKLHMNLDLGNRLPSFAIVEEALHHDSVRAEAATANLKCGDILVADRAYTDFKFLCSLAMRGVFYVVRWKRNIKLEVVLERPDDRGAVSGAVGRRDVLQGAQADLPDPRLHRLQRERGQVAGLDGAPGAHAPALPPPRLEMEAQLLAARGRGAGVRVAAAQRCGTARILRREWDSTWWNPRGAGLQTPVFAGFPAVRRRTNGTARVEKPAFSGFSGIAMKNGGVYRSSAYSRTQVATRIFEHYELAPMRSGMVVKKQHQRVHFRPTEKPARTARERSSSKSAPGVVRSGPAMPADIPT